MKKILLADDHVVVRSGIKLLLLKTFKPAEIYEASGGDAVLENLKEHVFDLIILDIQMPKTDTIGLMETIHLQYPDAKVLMFSMSAEKILLNDF